MPCGIPWLASKLCLKVDNFDTRGHAAAAAAAAAVPQGLYRTSQNRRLADFLSRDFSQPNHRQAASKNAFVLLGQHRHALAAAFFVLGEPSFLSRIAMLLACQ